MPYRILPTISPWASIMDMRTFTCIFVLNTSLWASIRDFEIFENKNRKPWACIGEPPKIKCPPLLPIHPIKKPSNVSKEMSKFRNDILYGDVV